MRLRGKVAVVTGSATGIGRATALLFADHGATVIGLDRAEADNASLLEELRRRPGGGEVHTVDLRDRAAVTAIGTELAGRHPRIDVLFNNAGAFVMKSVADTTPEVWDEMLELHLTSAFLLTRALLPCLQRSGAGAVVNNASIDGLFGHPLAPAYSIAKGGMVAMTHSMAYGLGRAGVRVNCIASGGIQSPLTRTLGLTEESASALVHATPLGRWGTPEEVARVALFLATEDSSYVTGAVLTVDGGRTAVTAGVATMVPRPGGPLPQPPSQASSPSR